MQESSAAGDLEGALPFILEPPWRMADAALEAARLQDLLLDRGDDEGRLVWQRIRREIEALQAPHKDKPN
jgi:hypothetical protein